METYVSMTGWVGSAVEYRCLTSADRSYTTHHASFRLAATPRIRRGGAWTDGETNWITVDPVTVWGKLSRETWERDGETNERTVIEAVVVGHDLNRGTSMFKKNERPQPYEDQDMGDLIEKVETPESPEQEDLAAAAREDRLALA
jgi:single-strand DNA-binding protein